MHHSLLHLVAATAKMLVDRTLEIDDSSRTVLNASSATIANVQRASRSSRSPLRYFSLPHGSIYVLPKADISRSEPYLIRDRLLVLFYFESLCQTLRTKRHRADLQIHCFGDNYTGLARSKVSLQLGPCAKPGLTFPFTALFTYVSRSRMSFSALRHTQSRKFGFPIRGHICAISSGDPNPANPSSRFTY